MLPRPIRLTQHLSKLCRSFSSTTSPPPLVGTAPAYARHLILHGPPNSHSSWPSHLESVSPLLKQLGARWGKHPELRKLGFTFAEGKVGTKVVGGAWGKTSGRFKEPQEGAEEESYSGFLYPDFIPVPALSESSLEAFEAFYLALPPPAPPTTASPGTTPPRTHIYVCTHGARDCRCGDIGEPLYQDLVSAARRRKIGDKVEIRRISHVGGHVWAANALVYREGGTSDWYGLLRKPDVPELLNLAISPLPSTWWSRWRGRLGLSPDETRDLYRTAYDGLPNKKKDRVPVALGDSVPLLFKTWDGEELSVLAYEGETIMEAARRHDLPSIMATCGGHCECATCHVHITPATSPSAASDAEGRAPVAVPIEAPVPALTEEEEEQLDFAMGRNDHSRLSCQIPVTQELGAWVKRGGWIALPRY